MSICWSESHLWSCEIYHLDVDNWLELTNPVYLGVDQEMLGHCDEYKHKIVLLITWLQKYPHGRLLSTSLQKCDAKQYILN